MQNNGQGKRASKRGKRSRGRPRRQIHAHAAGIDCGSKYHFAAVPEGCDPEPVRRFRTFTTDLHGLADWFKACGITTVAMEATGVYWIPVYEILEERGLEVLLVNARHVKNVPGRKSDVSDCQWIQELHSYGLLRGSFRPSAEIATLRSYLRHREMLGRQVADTIRRMQKTLGVMNLQLHTVISDISGQTGMRILRDIAGGVNDPKRLAQHRHRRCSAPRETIEAALTGNYRPEHVFALRQHLELYDVYQSQIAATDQQIESLLQRIAPERATPLPALPPARYRLVNKNTPDFDVRPLLYQLTGADLTQIDALGPLSALQIVSEIGLDMGRWPTERHFTSWLALAPRNKISGGKLLSSRTRPSANRAAAVLRICAMSAGRSSTALGAYYRRIAYRAGKAKAITATARKLAILVYHVLRGDFDYRDPGAEAYEAQYKARTLKNLRRKARQLGFGLLELQTGELTT